MEPSYTCPGCGIEQHDVYVQSGYLLRKPDDGWYTYRCPGCGQILKAYLLEDCGLLP